MHHRWGFRFRMVAQDYTNHRYTVRIITDDGGKHLAVYAEYGLNGEEPYHTEIDTNFMGWRTAWFQSHGYIDGIMEAKDVDPNELVGDLSRLRKDRRYCSWCSYLDHDDMWLCVSCFTMGRFISYPSLIHRFLI